MHLHSLRIHRLLQNKSVQKTQDKKQVLVDLSHGTKNEVKNTRKLVIVFTTEAAEG